MINRNKILFLIVLGLAFYGKTEAQAIIKIDSVKIDSPNKVFHGPVKINNSCIALINTGPDGKTNDDYKAIFESALTFTGDTFISKVYLKGSRFDSNAIFSNAHFLKPVNFYLACFDSSVDFSGSRFDSLANFSGVNFSRKVYFSYATFQTELNLSALKLSPLSRLECYNTTLPHLIDFSYNLSLPVEVDFTNANFDKEIKGKVHYINLVHSDIPKVRIDYEHFKLYFYNYYYIDSDFVFKKDTVSREPLKIKNSLTIYGDNNDSSIYDLSDTNLVAELLGNKYVTKYLVRVFPSFKYYSNDGFGGLKRELFFPGKINLDSDAVRVFIQKCANGKAFPKLLADEDRNCIYESVLNNFLTGGRNISYMNLDIEFKDLQNGAFILPHIWNCYGYHKEWVFWWIALFLLVFTTISFFMLGHLNGSDNDRTGAIYPISNIPVLMPLKQSLQPFSFHKLIWHQLIRRLWYSFLYTSSIFFLFSMKIDSFNFKKWDIIYIIIIYTAGILCLAYAANFVLQK